MLDIRSRQHNKAPHCSFCSKDMPSVPYARVTCTCPVRICPLRTHPKRPLMRAEGQRCAVAALAAPRLPALGVCAASSRCRCCCWCCSRWCSSGRRRVGHNAAAVSAGNGNRNGAQCVWIHTGWVKWRWGEVKVVVVSHPVCGGMRGETDCGVRRSTMVEEGQRSNSICGEDIIHRLSRSVCLCFQTLRPRYSPLTLPPSHWRALAGWPQHECILMYWSVH